MTSIFSSITAVFVATLLITSSFTSVEVNSQPLTHADKYCYVGGFPNNVNITLNQPLYIEPSAKIVHNPKPKPTSKPKPASRPLTPPPAKKPGQTRPAGARDVLTQPTALFPTVKPVGLSQCPETTSPQAVLHPRTTRRLSLFQKSSR